jgi:exonuclease III
MGEINSTQGNIDFKQDFLHEANILPTNNDYSNLHNSQNLLKIYHQNICVLRYKMNELLSFLHPDLPHVSCLTEHNLNHLEIENLVMDNYNLGAKYCRNSSLKGGTCVFKHSQLNVTVVNVDTYCTDQDIEVCAVKLQLISSHICVFSIYRAPSGNFTHFLHKLDMILKSLYCSKIEFIICGDINVDYLSDNNRKNQLNSLLISYNLFSTVNFPTRIQNNSCSAIDNIFIDYSRLGTFRIHFFL